MFSSTILVLLLNTMYALLLVEYPTKNPSSAFPSNLPSLITNTAAFFKDGWDVVGNEVVAAVREFFSNGNLLKELN
ncbi:hypothetical protein Tco_0350275, partial [Tanacetum coccineum]